MTLIHNTISGNAHNSAPAKPQPTTRRASGNHQILEMRFIVSILRQRQSARKHLSIEI